MTQTCLQDKKTTIMLSSALKWQHVWFKLNTEKEPAKGVYRRHRCKVSPGLTQRMWLWNWGLEVEQRAVRETKSSDQEEIRHAKGRLKNLIHSRKQRCSTWLCGTEVNKEMSQRWSWDVRWNQIMVNLSFLRRSSDFILHIQREPLTNSEQGRKRVYIRFVTKRTLRGTWKA